MHPPTVGADSIRPQGWKIELSVEWNQFPVTVLGFPRGEAGFFGNWHFGTDWQKRLMRGGDRVDDECGWMSGKCSGLYHSTGKSETFSYRCTSSVTFIGSEEPLKATASPRGKPRGSCGRLVPFNEWLNPVGWRADAIRPYRAFSKSPRSAIVRWLCR